MRVTSNNVAAAFVPFSITIAFDSDAEAKAFRYAVSRNVTLPDAAAKAADKYDGDSAFARQYTYDLLAQLQAAMNDAGYGYPPD